jgi:DMSO/TMAO reductase YedYZ heme-binding membrane subunit
VAFALGRLHHLGVVAAVIYWVASFWLEPSFKALVQPAALGVILMLLLTLASQKVVTPRMAALRAQMVSVDATAAR